MSDEAPVDDQTVPVADPAVAVVVAEVTGVTTPPLVATFEHVIQLVEAADGDIPKAITLLNSSLVVNGAGFAHIETIRAELVAGLGFTKRLLDTLLAIFPAPVPAK